jgi:hypothetical protein
MEYAKTALFIKGLQARGEKEVTPPTVNAWRVFTRKYAGRRTETDSLRPVDRGCYSYWFVKKGGTQIRVQVTFNADRPMVKYARKVRGDVIDLIAAEGKLANK